MEKRYIISDASKKVSVEPHVLRYWEEELELSIPRNEMGHRYYREEDIALLLSIKSLKAKGFQLRAIKLLLPDLQKVESMDESSIHELKEELNEKVMLMEESSAHKGNTYFMARQHGGELTVSHHDMTAGEERTKADTMEQFRCIMKSILLESMQEGNKELSQSVSESVSERIIKELDYQIRTKEEADAERFRQLEAVISGQAVTLSEAAASSSKGKKRFSLTFKKKKDKKRD